MANPTPIEHVVMLMMENRSFDHLLGVFPKINGVSAPNGHPNPQYFNLADPTNQASKKYPAGSPAEFVIPAVDIGKTGFGGPGHSFADATVQMDHNAATAVPDLAPLDVVFART